MQVDGKIFSQNVQGAPRTDEIRRQREKAEEFLEMPEISEPEGIPLKILRKSTNKIPQPERADYKCKRQHRVNNTKAQALRQTYLQGKALARAGGRNKRASRV